MQTDTAAAPLCYGSEDEQGKPTCTGPDPRPVVVGAGKTRFRTTWCRYCRMESRADGITVRITD